jgi:hypothetical protein
MERYIGMDVHANSTTMCVLNERGRKLQTTVMQTHAATLIESVRAVPRRRCLCLEESTHSTWLFEVLRECRRHERGLRCKGGSRWPLGS